MAYRIVDDIIGSQPIANTETTALHPLGTIVRAVDPPTARVSSSSGPRHHGNRHLGHLQQR